MTTFYLSENGRVFFLDDGFTPAPLPDGLALWPKGLPYARKRSGYSWEQDDGRLITDMEQGPPQIDTAYLRTPMRVQCTFVFTQAQKKQYVDFYRGPLAAGRLPVRIPVLDERGLVYMDAFILSNLRFALSKNRWTTQLQLVSTN